MSWAFHRSLSFIAKVSTSHLPKSITTALYIFSLYSCEIDFFTIKCKRNLAANALIVSLDITKMTSVQIFVTVLAATANIFHSFSYVMINLHTAINSTHSNVTASAPDPWHFCGAKKFNTLILSQRTAKSLPSSTSNMSFKDRPFLQISTGHSRYTKHLRKAKLTLGRSNTAPLSQIPRTDVNLHGSGEHKRRKKDGRLVASRRTVDDQNLLRPSYQQLKEKVRFQKR